MLSIQTFKVPARRFCHYSAGYDDMGRARGVPKLHVSGFTCLFIRPYALAVSVLSFAQNLTTLFEWHLEQTLVDDDIEYFVSSSLLSSISLSWCGLHHYKTHQNIHSLCNGNVAYKIRIILYRTIRGYSLGLSVSSMRANRRMSNQLRQHQQRLMYIDMVFAGYNYYFVSPFHLRSPDMTVNKDVSFLACVWACRLSISQVIAYLGQWSISSAFIFLVSAVSKRYKINNERPTTINERFR